MDCDDIGVLCSEEGCRIYDYLPFLCSLCNKHYCLLHRSRFIHSNCVNTNNITINNDLNDNASVKDMFKAVESRFDSISNNETNHYAIKSSNIPDNIKLNQSTKDKINKLNSNNKASMIAKSILLKGKSTGDQNIDPSSRQYLEVFIDNSSINESIYIFCNKFNTIGDLLHYINISYPQVIYQSSVPLDNHGLVLYTDDTPDWKHWDRRLVVNEVFNDFDKIYVNYIKLTDITTNQSNIEKTVATTTLKPVDSNNSTSSNDNIPNSNKNFKVGDKVNYRNSDSNIYEATIVAVHLDDFPNVYFTISYFIDGTIRERQTDGNRLIALAASVIDENIIKNLIIDMKGVTNVISISITHKPVTYDVINIDNTITIIQLKQELCKLTNIPSNKIKLINRGMTLSDQMTVQSTNSKIINGSKLMMLGR